MTTRQESTTYLDLFAKHSADCLIVCAMAAVRCFNAALAFVFKEIYTEDDHSISASSQSPVFSAPSVFLQSRSRPYSTPEDYDALREESNVAGSSAFMKAVDSIDFLDIQCLICSLSLIVEMISFGFVIELAFSHGSGTLRVAF